MSTVTTENTMSTLETVLRAGLGRRAAVGFSVTGGTTVATGADDRVTIHVVADTPAGAEDGTSGVFSPLATIDTRSAGVQITGRDLRRIVAGILPACDTESSRYALGGTLVEVAEGSLLCVVATDGRRMHVGHVQPSHIAGQASPIVHADHWQAFDATLRGAVRRLLGAGGRRLDAVIDRGLVTIDIGCHAPTGGEVVSLAWSSSGADGRLTVRATALALAGRFPRWRDIFEQVTSTDDVRIDAAAVADAVAEFRAVHKAAERAGRAAYMAEPPAAPRCRARKPGEYHHPMGVTVSAAGMIGRGCEWTSSVPVTAVPVCLDPAFLADAIDGATAWGGDVFARASDDVSPVLVTAGGECGPRFVGVIMPLAVDA